MHKKNPEINQPDSFHVNILVCVYVASIKARAVIVFKTFGVIPKLFSRHLQSS